MLDFHRQHGKLAKNNRHKALRSLWGNIERRYFGYRVSRKPPGDGASINGGFFVLNVETIDLIDNDQTIWEIDPLNKLASSGQLEAFQAPRLLACYGYSSRQASS